VNDVRHPGKAALRFWPQQAVCIRDHSDPDHSVSF
jgi:hypothetical protein